jgi:hypothetical protein
VKLILQIAFGVFLGTLMAQFVIDSWHSHQEQINKHELEKASAERDKIRKEKGDYIRNLILQNRQGKVLEPRKPPNEFIPEDTQQP